MDGTFKAPAKPYLIRGDPDESQSAMRVVAVTNPAARRLLSVIEPAARFAGTELKDPRQLVIPLDKRTLVGIDPATIRVFRVGARGQIVPSAESGYNPGLGAAWALITAAGTYFAAGVPKDRLLQNLLTELAISRRRPLAERANDGEGALRNALAPILEPPREEVAKVRRLLTVLELATAANPPAPTDLEYGHGRHPIALRLPGGASLDELREHLFELPRDVELVEESIVLELGFDRVEGPPWDTRRGAGPPWRWTGGSAVLHELPEEWRKHWPWPLCWLVSPDWWMYHADVEHSGWARGCSSISSATAGNLAPLATLQLGGDMVSVPCIVDGKIYVGTGGSDMALYKIDLVGNTIEGRFPTTGFSSYGIEGIGGTPAVVEGKVYFTSLSGRVYCVDTTTMTVANPPPAALWITDLKGNWGDIAPFTPQSQMQPITNPDGDTWSGPLVVNGKVYVGSGEGEAGALGFVWCLDAATGQVQWVFCTDQFTTGVANQPNQIPSSALPGGLPAWAASRFTVYNEPAGGLPYKGASVWSSCAYDSVNDRIWVGTGNSTAAAPGTAATDPVDLAYGSGVLCLQAGTGDLVGYFIPAHSDSYRTLDGDIDVPGSPTVYSIGAHRRVGIGGKSGSYFVFDAADPGPVLTPLARRNMLPVDADTGLPLVDVDPISPPWYENSAGIFATAAADPVRHCLFIGIGGYDPGMMNSPTTPFMRAVKWDSLEDHWPLSKDAVPNSHGGTDHVWRYIGPNPPMYQPGTGAGLSSPALVNDVVFVTTAAGSLGPQIYAFRTSDGNAVWSAPDLSGYAWCLGVAIYGDYVVAAVGDTIHRYTLVPHHPPWWWRLVIEEELMPRPVPWPPPPPPWLEPNWAEAVTLKG